MAQEKKKTWVPQVMVKQETLQQVMGETLDQPEMVKSEECDLDSIRYNFYEKSCEYSISNVDIDIKDFNLTVKQKDSKDEFVLKKNEWINNKKLTLSEIAETSEINYTSPFHTKYIPRR